MNNKSSHLDIYNMMFDVSNYNTHPDNEFRFQIVIDFLNKNKIDSMIDIGAGRGNLIKMVMNDYPNIEVFSTDLNKYHNFNVPFYEINLCGYDVYFLNSGGGVNFHSNKITHTNLTDSVIKK